MTQWAQLQVAPSLEDAKFAVQSLSKVGAGKTQEARRLGKHNGAGKLKQEAQIKHRQLCFATHYCQGRCLHLSIALQSEIEAEHASTRIRQRETRATSRTVNPRQRKQVSNNNPQSADNQRPTAHTHGNASKTTTQHQNKTTQGPLWAPWHLRVPRYRQQWHIHATLPCVTSVILSV
jgi:hypothetical protein